MISALYERWLILAGANVCATVFGLGGRIEFVRIWNRVPKLLQNGGLSLSEISARTDIPMATTHRILGFMKNRGYVYQDSRETYYPSPLLP